MGVMPINRESLVMLISDLSSDTLSVVCAERIATITLKRPKVLNALDRPQRQRLDQALRALDARDDVRVIILTGEGRAFCAGQDQNESAGMTAEDSARRISDYMGLYRSIRSLNKPLIARINGYATGSGLQIALLCDIRIASASAKLGMPELNVGSAAIVGSALMQPIVGEAVMKKLVLTADIIDAQHAQHLGILDEVYPDEPQMDARVAALAAKFADWQPMAISITKKWWKKMSDAQFEAAAREAAEGHALNFASGAYTEGARRFKEQKQGRK